MDEELSQAVGGSDLALCGSDVVDASLDEEGVAEVDTRVIFKKLVGRIRASEEWKLTLKLMEASFMVVWFRVTWEGRLS
ncbi:Protein of uncharacterized function [Sesbania bispinosa]|nr:Protein of uncharacterized function [Sesbania bispinosa]